MMEVFEAFINVSSMSKYQLFDIIPNIHFLLISSLGMKVFFHCFLLV